MRDKVTNFGSHYMLGVPQQHLGSNCKLIIILPKNAAVGSLVYMKQNGAHS